MRAGAEGVLNGNLEKFVFVVGCQRSGTTLMGQVIGAHPSALLVDETDEVYSQIRAIFDADDNGLKRELIATLRQSGIAKYRGQERSENTEADTLVLQAPNLTWSHAQIARSFPGARVVCMLRDVRAVVVSMQNLPNIPFVENQIRFFRQSGFIENDFPDECQRLVDEDTPMAVKMALVAKIKMSLAENFRAFGIPVLEVRYEDLILESRETVTRVMRHIGLPFDESCLAHERKMLGCGPGDTARTRSIDQSSIAKWHGQLGRDVEDAIWEAVGDFFEDFGYTRNATIPSARADPI